MSLEQLSEYRCFDGIQGFYRHSSRETGTSMQFSVYLPPNAGKEKVPTLWYLSGLTCTEENFTVKAGAQRYAASNGIALIAPDTSPRGAGIDGEDDSYDLGTGAGFYVDATRAPWSPHYRMYSYITGELQKLACEAFPIDQTRQGITGHSMGGHGALTLGLKHPGLYRSVSAFAPICAPSQCPWGEKALEEYLGDDRSAWRAYDACALIEDGFRTAHLLVDQGENDEFLATQLKPDVLEKTCGAHDQPLTLQRHSGYDHSYYFIASFIGSHINYHATALNALA